MTISAALSNAADIVQRGWTQRRYWAPGKDFEPCYCLLGALNHARAKFSNNLSECDSLYKYVHKAINEIDVSNAYKWRPLSGWNDSPDRTQDEVVAVLRRAADLARDDGK
jgi:hypothetical protein